MEIAEPLVGALDSEYGALHESRHFVNCLIGADHPDADRVARVGAVIGLCQGTIEEG